MTDEVSSNIFSRGSMDGSAGSAAQPSETSSELKYIQYVEGRESLLCLLTFIEAPGWVPK